MIYPFFLTIIASLSTMLGTIPIFFNFKNKHTFITASLTFASGIMLSISIFDLIPESINYLSTKNNNLTLILICFSFIMLGIIISMILDKIIDKYNHNDLYKVGLLSMIAIIIHNIPEGIITFIVSSKNLFLGISIAIAITMHNIPEGISISIPIYYGTNNKFKAILYTFISSLSEILGAIITYLFLKDYISNFNLGIILSFTAGIMINISINKLLITGLNNSKRLSYIFFSIGLIFMLISLLINKLVS